MTKPTTVDLINDHREALALAVYEQRMEAHNYGARNAAGTAPELDQARIDCNSIGFRCDVLKHPRVRERYINIRGFDPREVPAGLSIRWLQ